jgi:hypothetical protein
MVLCSGSGAASIAGDEAAREATRGAITPNLRPDGSVHTDNIWRFAIGPQILERRVSS